MVAHDMILHHSILTGVILMCNMLEVIAGAIVVGFGGIVVMFIIFFLALFI